MAFWEGKGRGGSRGKGHGPQCSECDVPIPREFFAGRGDAPQVIHCTGSVSAWQKGHIPTPHHGRLSYGDCWRCGGYLGCDQCSGARSEVLCVRCAAWGTAAAFAEHGPCLNTESMVQKRHGVRAPTFEEYPPAFKAYFRRANENDPVAAAPTLEEWKGAPRPDMKIVPEPESQDFDSELPLFAGPTPASSEEQDRMEDKRRRIREKAREMGLVS